MGILTFCAADVVAQKFVSNHTNLIHILKSARWTWFPTAQFKIFQKNIWANIKYTPSLNPFPLAPFSAEKEFFYTGALSG
jgi:hypothetical protein